MKASEPSLEKASFFLFLFLFLFFLLFFCFFFCLHLYLMTGRRPSRPQRRGVRQSVVGMRPGGDRRQDCAGMRRGGVEALRQQALRSEALRQESLRQESRRHGSVSPASSQEGELDPRSKCDERRVRSIPKREPKREQKQRRRRLVSRRRLVERRLLVWGGWLLRSWLLRS